LALLVVAGGGGGGRGAAGGGGGGGLYYKSNETVTGGGPITVVVGEGGAGGGFGPDDPVLASNGGESSFGSIIVSGGGAGGSAGDLNGFARSGGSGGGGSGGLGSDLSGGGSMATDANRFANPGGSGIDLGGGGGGGAGTSGGAGYVVTCVDNWIGCAGGAGGDGKEISITGVATYFAGGGGGGAEIIGGAGGRGGGGAGVTCNENTSGGSGTPNTGGGGGGFRSCGTPFAGGAGGSGIVVVKYVAPAVGTASQLDVSRNSAGTGHGSSFSTQPRITIRDSAFNTVSTSTALVTATVSSGGTVTGSDTATAVSGVATFNNLGVEGTKGTIYTITYSAIGLTSTSEAVTLTATICDGASFACQIGDTGPGSGKIFYVSSGGFSCGQSLTSTCNYLEASTSSSSPSWSPAAAPWSENFSDAIGSTSDAIGSGYSNTLKMVRQIGAGTSGAGSVTRSYLGGGLNDWYLPSKLEFVEMMNHLDIISMPNMQDFWTSTETNATTALIYRTDGVLGDGTSKDSSRGVRPIRAFGMTPPEAAIISVREIGGVAAPVRGEMPVNSVIAANGYTGSVSWSSSAGALSGAFQEATIYTGTITLTAASGYTLSGVTANFFTVPGATLVSHSPDSGVVTAVFPATGRTLPTINYPASDSTILILLGQNTDIQLDYVASGAITASVSTGSLPNGLSLSGDGHITGTATTVGSSIVNLGITDSYSQSATNTNILFQVLEAYDPETGNGAVACVADTYRQGSGYFTVAEYIVKLSFACSGLAAIPSGVLEIDVEAFVGGNNLTSITIPSSVDTIGELAFAFTGIRSLIIPHTVTRIDAQAFADLEDLTTLVIGNGLEDISDRVFSNANNLTNLVIGSGVKNIGERAFENASALVSVTIPNNVETIGDMAFQEAESLTTLIIGNNVQTIGSRAFAFATNLESLVIPNSVIRIDALAFVLPSSLTNLVLGNRLTTIGESAFDGANRITTLNIPESVNNIGAFAFFGATRLTSINIRNLSPTIGSEAFVETDALVSINYCGTPLNKQYLGINSSVEISCAITYSITVNSGSNGSISPGTSVLITEGSAQSYTITPDSGYEIDAVIIDSIRVSTNSLTIVNQQTKSFTFSNVNADHTISVTFKSINSMSEPIIVAPVPVPYLKTLTPPKLNLKDGKLVCSPGTYNAGYTLDGVIQGSPAAIYSPASYTYNLLINGFVQTPLAITSPTSSIVWEMQQAPSGSVISCAVTAGFNSLTNTDRSNLNNPVIITAMTTQAQSIATAESIYSAAVSLNSKIYQTTIADNRVKWRKSVEKNRATYLAELERVKALGANKQTRAQNAHALKTYIASQKQIASNYAASKPAALAVKDAADKVAFERKNAAISEANSTYGSFIESIGYGVLIP
jgi:hypothetical protein